MVNLIDNPFNKFKHTVNVNKKSRANDGSRERILVSAKREFAQKGFHGARMEEIARDAGVNKALIHYYFDNKESLYRQVVMRAFGLGDRQEIAIYAGRWELTPPQKLYLLLYFIINLTIRDTDRERYRLLYWEIVEGNRLHEQGIREFVFPVIDLIVQVIKDGVDGGDFETNEPRLLTMFMVFSVLHFNLDKEIFGNSPVFYELYGNKNDGEILNLLIRNLFKTLSPRDRWLSVPEVPDEILKFLDRLIDIARTSSSEGYAEGLFMKLKEAMS